VSLRQLDDTLDDIRLLAGSEAYDAARSFYKYVKGGLSVYDDHGK
jgi:hypothetical protein